MNEIVNCEPFTVNRSNKKLLTTDYWLLTTKKGFTLIELMVVIGIIGIVMLIAIPNFAGMQRSARIHAAAQEIAQDFRNIRERALAKGLNYEIGFNTNTLRHYAVTYTDLNGVVHSDTQKIASTTGGNIHFGHTNATGNPPEGNGPVPSDGIDFIGDVLRINNHGGASRGVVYITDGRETYAIGVNTLGKVRVYHYANGAWN
uniref:Type II secretion system protein n=1 Tax=candidate division WOR-3 bacterium TaxID=2052148 RepID=A0A7C4TIR0_UNCW3